MQRGFRNDKTKSRQRIYPKNYTQFETKQQLLPMQDYKR
nr:MAG TPA: hypothetical protein [Caudoviricetes sp.]